MQEISPNDTQDISSTQVKDMVNQAFKMQRERKQIRLNGKLREQEVEKFCKLSLDGERILFSAVEKFGLSNRALESIKKVARTIADLDSSQTIEKKHLLEALSYRKR